MRRTSKGERRTQACVFGAGGFGLYPARFRQRGQDFLTLRDQAGREQCMAQKPDARAAGGAILRQ